MRYTTYNQPWDDQEILAGDLGFVGLRMDAGPAALNPGEYADALNAEVVEGELACRKGAIKLPWTSRLVDASTDPQPFDVVYGATEYEAPDGTLWMVVAADGRMYRMRENQAAAEIQIPPGVVIDADVTFANTSMGLVCFRGAGKDNLLMPTLDQGFVTMTKLTGGAYATENPSGDGSQDIPKASRGEWIGNRLWVPFATSTEKDMVDISDYLNPTRSVGVRSQARINQGSGDSLLRVFKFSEDKVVCFKSRSIYVLYNSYGDLAQMQLDDLTKEYGLAAADAVVGVGQDVWFLAQKRGIVSVTQTQTNQLQGVDIPKSVTIHPLIERINWSFAWKSQAIAHGNKVLFAVPLDDARGLGGNLVTLETYAGPMTLELETGRDYYWTKGANDATLTNGSEQLTKSGYFTAASGSVTITGTGAVTCQVQRVYDGVCNAILVWDGKLQRWTSVHKGGWIGIKRFIKGTYLGEVRIFAITVDGFVTLLDEADAYDEVSYWTLSSTNLADSATLVFGTGCHVTVVPGQRYRWIPGIEWDTLQVGSSTYTSQVDFMAVTNKVVVLANTPSPIGFGFTLRRHDWKLRVQDIEGFALLRGYGSTDVGRTRQKRLSANIKTANPKFRITAKCDGVGEEWQVEPKRGTYQTFSRTKYRKPWNRKAYETTNRLDDHGEPYREDYSVILQENTVSSGAIEPGKYYLVQNVDPSLPAEILYNAQKYNEHEVFLGLAGVTTFTVNTAGSLVYAPDSWIDLGENGVDFDVQQAESISRNLPPKCRGLFVQPRFAWARGTFNLMACAITADPVDRGQNIKC